jgi:hypothetical protein
MTVGCSVFNFSFLYKARSGGAGFDGIFTSFQIPHLRPAEYKRSRLSRNRRTVNRAYGGVLSGSAVRERYDTLMVSFFFFFFLKR